MKRKFFPFKTSIYEGTLGMVLLITSLVSCSAPELHLSQQPYFDVPGFFEDQVNQLYRDSLIVIKTSEINGTSDMHQMPWTDWKKEFSLFYASDINKSAFMGKYDIDTTQNPSGDSLAIMISYKANDPELRTRLLEVVKDKRTGAVTSIHIINDVSNFLSASHEELFYEPLRGYV